ncbi:MAG: DUF3179 domain-containing protein [Nitrososphaera sp.]
MASSMIAKRKGTLIAIIAAVGIASVAATLAASRLPTGPFDGPSSGAITDTRSPEPLVPLNEIIGGGPPRDGIPSIDNPKFVSVQDAGKFLQDFELVLGLNINGDIRAYPLQILVWHEIVNDEVGGVPVAVTYCPLCFTNQVFKRTIDGEVVEFGTSGKLYNSNLVMYDRSSDSYWSQALGQAIVGEHTAKKLERIPFDLANWADWKKLYPDSKVLSQNTGFGRPYGADPYGDYYTSPRVLFPVSNQDDRLGVKEIVVGMESNGIYRAYNIQDIEDKKVINNDISGNSFALMSLHPFMIRAYDSVVDGQALQFEYDPTTNNFVDIQTKSKWNFDGVAIEGEMTGKHLTRLPFDEGFWFEWVAFHPQTELYRG